MSVCVYSILFRRNIHSFSIAVYSLSFYDDGDYYYYYCYYLSSIVFFFLLFLLIFVEKKTIAGYEMILKTKHILYSICIESVFFLSLSSFYRSVSTSHCTKIVNTYWYNFRGVSDTHTHTREYIHKNLYTHT